MADLQITLGKPHERALGVRDSPHATIIVVNPGKKGCVARLSWRNDEGPFADAQHFLSSCEVSVHDLHWTVGQGITEGPFKRLLGRLIPAEPPSRAHACVCVVDHAAFARQTSISGVVQAREHSLQRALELLEELNDSSAPGYRSCAGDVQTLTRQAFSQPFTLQGEHSGEGQRDDKVIERAKVLFPTHIADLAVCNPVERADALIMAAYLAGIRMKAEGAGRKRRGSAGGEGSRYRANRRFPGQPHMAHNGEDQDEGEEEEKQAEAEEERPQHGRRAQQQQRQGHHRGGGRGDRRAAGGAGPAAAAVAAGEAEAEPALPWGRRPVARQAAAGAGRHRAHQQQQEQQQVAHVPPPRQAQPVQQPQLQQPAPAAPAGPGHRVPMRGRRAAAEPPAPPQPQQQAQQQQRQPPQGPQQNHQRQQAQQQAQQQQRQQGQQPPRQAAPAPQQQRQADRGTPPRRAGMLARREELAAAAERRLFVQQQQGRDQQAPQAPQQAQQGAQQGPQQGPPQQQRQQSNGSEAEVVDLT